MVTALPLRLALGLWLVALLSATAVHAGAWPRKVDTGFVSASLELGWQQDMDDAKWNSPTQDFASVYLEYGLTEQITVGLDLGGNSGSARKALAFVQYPLRNQDSGAKIAAQLAFGQINTEFVLRPGLMMGWGLKKGWFTVDSMAEMYVDTGVTNLKMDVTLGRNLDNDRKLILQLQTGLPDGGSGYVKFAPSVVMPVSDRIKLEAGASYGVIGDSSMGIKFGLWTEF